MILFSKLKSTWNFGKNKNHATVPLTGYIFRSEKYTVLETQSPNREVCLQEEAEIPVALLIDRSARRLHLLRDQLAMGTLQLRDFFVGAYPVLGAKTQSESEAIWHVSLSACLSPLRW